GPRPRRAQAERPPGHRGGRAPADGGFDAPLRAAAPGTDREPDRGLARRSPRPRGRRARDRPPGAVGLHGRGARATRRAGRVSAALAGRQRVRAWLTTAPRAGFARRVAPVAEACQRAASVSAPASVLA